MITNISGFNQAGRNSRPPPPDAFTFTVNDACRMAGFGRTTLYALAKSGQITLLKIGGRTLVSGESLRHLLGAAA